MREFPPDCALKFPTVFTAHPKDLGGKIVSLVKLSEDVVRRVTQHGVPTAMMPVLEAMIESLEVACERTFRDYDEKDGDDPNLAGLMCSRRAKNLTIDVIGEDDSDRFTDVEIVSNGGFDRTISVAGTRLHHYSAVDGPNSLRLKGGETKLAIAERASAQSQLFDTTGIELQPEDLVLAYQKDQSGLGQAWVGRMKNAENFAWCELVYAKKQAIEDEASSQERYDAPEEVQVPRVTLKSGAIRGVGKVVDSTD